MNVIDKVLSDRGGAYGSYENIARVSDKMIKAAEQGEGWQHLTAGEREAIRMTLHKIARIVNSPYAKGRVDGKARTHFDDSFVDAVGYLVLGNKSAFKG